MVRVSTPESFTASHHAAVEHTGAMIKQLDLLMTHIKASERDAAEKIAVYDANKRVADSTLFSGLGKPGIQNHTPVDHHELHEAGGADPLVAPIDPRASPVVISITTTASDVLKHSNDAEKTTMSYMTYVKVKEIVLGTDLSACRLKFDYKSLGGGQVNQKVYKNGAVIGEAGGGGSTSYVTRSEDFTDWVKGDLIQVYARTDFEGETCYVRNMRFYYDITSFTATLAPANQDP